MSAPSLRLSPETLFRLRIVAAVDALIAQGHGADGAVRLVAAESASLGRGARRVSVRTVQRWRRTMREQGVSGLEPVKRSPLDGSQVLPEALLTFVETEREADPKPRCPS